MIDLTPLDVRNKRGDFKKGMRGYDPQEVDVFLELVAERLEALVRENIQLRDRTRTLQEQVDAQAGREQAVQDALVTAQELRKDIRDQSQREADHVMREAESEARRIISEAEAEGRARVRALERQIDHARDSLEDMERRRARFLQEFRGLLQRELDVVEVEQERTPLEDRAIDLDLGIARAASAGSATGSKEPNAPVMDDAAAAKTDDAATTTADDAPAPADDAAAPADDPTPTADDAAAATADTGGPTAAAAGGRSGGEDAMAGPPDSTPEHPGTSDASETQTSGASGSGVSGANDAEGGSGSPAVSDAESAGEDGQGARSTATSEAVPGDRAQALDADVGELTGRGEDGTARRVAPPPEVADAPSSLELELMAGAAGSGGADSDSESESRGPAFPDVPDLETVLAEAGIDEVRPHDTEEISPPPADTASEDRLALFEEDEEDGKR